MKAIIALILTIVIGFTNTVSSQVLLQGERIELDSKVLSEQRHIQVLLPENYDSETNSTYPVIYLLDGDYNFHSVSGMLDSLANKGQLTPKLILVGIADKGTSAYRNNMSPTGQAKAFLSFLTDEVKPYIQQHYRTADNSILVGQSIGGLFVVNTLLESPQSFDNYVAISPSAWYENDLIVKKAAEKLPSITQVMGVYLSVADEVKMSIYGLVNEFDTHAHKQVNWNFKRYLDETHDSTGLIALRDSLKQIFKGWHLNEKQAEANSPQQTIAYYKDMVTDFGIRQSIPTGIAHILMRQHYRQNKANELPSFIANTIETLPESKATILMKYASFVGHYDTKEAALEILLAHQAEFVSSIAFHKAIAATYKQLGQDDKAKRHYQKALGLAQQQKAAQWQLNIIEALL